MNSRLQPAQALAELAQPAGQLAQARRHYSKLRTG
jgi:hypothetical protein